MAKTKIRTGDQVLVIAGKDKGLKGKVIKTIPEENRVLVEGVNAVTRHTKAGQEKDNQQGGIVKREAPLHISNVKLIDSDSKKSDKKDDSDKKSKSKKKED